MKDLEQVSIEQAYKYIKAVLEYGLYGEYDTSDPVVNALMSHSRFGIDSVEERRERNVEDGRRGGRKKTFADEDIYKLLDEGKSKKEVAIIMKCSDRTVERAIKRRRETDSPTPATKQILPILSNDTAE